MTYPSHPFFWPWFVAFVVILATNSPLFAQAEKGKRATKEVPLKSIYATSGQPELASLSTEFKVLKNGEREFKQPYGRALEHILDKYRSGASDVMLLWGDDLSKVIAGTGAYLARGYAEPILGKQDPRKQKCWLVGYLGVGRKDPLTWRLNSVEVHGKSMRISYEKNELKGQPTTPFFFWTYIGELEADVYTLELFDSREKQITVVRRVNLP